MATHCNILAWKIPWTEETGGLQSMARRKVAVVAASAAPRAAESEMGPSGQGWGPLRLVAGTAAAAGGGSEGHPGRDDSPPQEHV